MLFNTWSYLLFLALAVPLHWALPRRLRVGFLALCSLFFYAVWRWEFCFLIVFSAGVDYLAAHRIAAAREAGQRGKRWLALSLLVNISLLLAFKYTYFVWDNVRVVASAGGHSLPRLQDLGLRIVLPLGISFYTFQTISYSIDVYRGVCEPLRRFVPFFCYVIFWPQLIAGPVLRANEVIPQLQGDRSVTRGDVGAGLALILGGLFK
ncbi:MAG TPA: hypothetical protein DEA08_12850 [Planctomycetes bacterium]|nr:hypothetical protein [Planctomycetota bacterium]